MSPGPRHTVWSSRSGTSRPMTEARRSASFTSSGRRSIARSQRLLDGVRHRDPAGRVGLLGDRPAQLLEEERVALRLAQDRGGERAVPAARPRGDPRRCAGCRPARAAGARAGSRRTCPSTAAGSPGRYVNSERTEAPAVALDQRVQALLRRAVDPLEILAHEHDRPLPAAPEAHLPEGVHGPGPDRLRREHAQPLAPPASPRGGGAGRPPTPPGPSRAPRAPSAPSGPSRPGCRPPRCGSSAGGSR